MKALDQTGLLKVAQLAKQEAADAAAQAVASVPTVPPGGSAGQVLAKASGEDGDLEWVTPPFDGGGLGAYPIKLPQPDVEPTGKANAVGYFEADGQLYLVCAHAASPYITAWRIEGDDAVSIPCPSLPGTGNGLGIARYPAGQEPGSGILFAAAHNTTPFVTAYGMQGGQLVKKTLPATPSGTCLDVALCSYFDGSAYQQGYAAALQASPYNYVWLGVAKTGITGLGGARTNSATVHQDGEKVKIIVGGNTTWMHGVETADNGASFKSPFLSSDWGALPTSGNCLWVGWSDDGTALAATATGAPYFYIFKYGEYHLDATPSSYQRELMPNPVTSPNSAAQKGAWSQDGRFLATALKNAPGIALYGVTTSAVYRVSDPVEPPTVGGASVAWSPDGHELAVGLADAPWIVRYRL